MSATDFGLIGHPLGHSLSPFIHRELLAVAGLPGVYRLFDLPPEALPEAVPRLLEELGGFNCTIPYKEAVVPYLAGLDPSAAAIGAVNTVWQQRGFNTDLQAFLDDCPPIGRHRLLILGAGGVSRTMAFAAASAGAPIWILARRPEQAACLAADIRRTYPHNHVACPADLSEWLAQQHAEHSAGHSAELRAGRHAPRWGLLNGTPLGLWPNPAGMPFPAELLSRFNFVYDTVYNPTATRLILAARSRGIKAKSGLGMLFGQALAAQRIWHPGADFPAAALAGIRSRLAAAILEKFPMTIILNGYMGSGKSTVGRILAARLRIPFQDLDSTIEQAAGQSIPDIFASQGEPGFRRLELDMLGQLLKSGSSQVLAIGGGALLDPAAEAMVRQAAALIVYLDTPPDEIRRRVGQGEGRPLLYQQGEERFVGLYRQRQERYQSLADLRADGSAEPEKIAAAIAGDLGYEGDWL